LKGRKMFGKDLPCPEHVSKRGNLKTFGPRGLRAEVPQPPRRKLGIPFLKGGPPHSLRESLPPGGEGNAKRHSEGGVKRPILAIIVSEILALPKSTSTVNRGRRGACLDWEERLDELSITLIGQEVYGPNLSRESVRISCGQAGRLV